MEDAPNGGAGEAGRASDLDHTAPFVMALKAFDDAKTAGKREDEIGIAGVGGKFAAVINNGGGIWSGN